MLKRVNRNAQGSRSALGPVSTPRRREQEEEKGDLATAVVALGQARDSASMSRDDAFTLLGLPVGARSNEIRRRYLQLTLLVHPDKNNGVDRGFGALTRAYRIADGTALNVPSVVGAMDRPLALPSPAPNVDGEEKQFPVIRSNPMPIPGRLQPNPEFEQAFRGVLKLRESLDEAKNVNIDKQHGTATFREVLGGEKGKKEGWILFAKEERRWKHYTPQNGTGVNATGTYDFVVHADRPKRVLVGRGHHELSGGESVLYAGEVTLQNGEVVRWSNRSGHSSPNRGSPIRPRSRSTSSKPSTSTRKSSAGRGSPGRPRRRRRSCPWTTRGRSKQRPCSWI
ncbi:MAG: J domain-containing protein [Minicystis sp.]